MDRVIAVESGQEDTLLGELASVYLAGAQVNWSAVHAGESPDPALLPNYPFQRRRFWPPEFAKKVESRRTAEPGRQAHEGLYCVDWQDADRPLIPQDTAHAGAPRNHVVLLHRAASADAAAACLALQAAGLHVQNKPINSGPLPRTELQTLTTRGRDCVWLYLLPSRGEGTEPVGENRTRLEDVLVITQVMLELGSTAPALYVVTVGTQQINATARPADAAAWGLGRVLAAEAPGLPVSFIDLQVASPDWGGLADTIASGCNQPELALIDGRALAPALVPMQFPPEPTQGLVSSEASYIVTGAFGFIGELTTRWLVRQGAGKLFLVGHNPPREAAVSALEAARAAGTEVRTRHCRYLHSGRRRGAVCAGQHGLKASQRDHPFRGHAGGCGNQPSDTGEPRTRLRR